MHVYNNGAVAFAKPVPPDMEDGLYEIFDNTGVFFDREGNVLEIVEVYGDLDTELDDVSALAERNGVGIDPEGSFVEYTGDYDGGYLFEDGRFVSHDKWDYILRTTPAEALLAELRRRGVKTGKN